MSWLDEVKKLAAAKVLVLEQVDAATADMRWKTCWNCEQMDHSNKTAATVAAISRSRYGQRTAAHRRGPWAS